MKIEDTVKVGRSGSSWANIEARAKALAKKNGVPLSEVRYRSGTWDGPSFAVTRDETDAEKTKREAKQARARAADAKRRKEYLAREKKSRDERIQAQLAITRTEMGDALIAALNDPPVKKALMKLIKEVKA